MPGVPYLLRADEMDASHIVFYDLDNETEKRYTDIPYYG